MHNKDYVFASKMSKWSRFEFVVCTDVSLSFKIEKRFDVPIWFSFVFGYVSVWIWEVKALRNVKICEFLQGAGGSGAVVIYLFSMISIFCSRYDMNLIESALES